MRTVTFRRLSVVLAWAFVLGTVSSCRNKPFPDDSGQVDFSRSKTYTAKPQQIGYPGAENDVTVILSDRQGNRISVKAPVRIGCSGAVPRERRATSIRGVYRFRVEPLPEKSTAICAITVGSRLMPRAVRFDITRPCDQDDL